MKEIQSQYLLGLKKRERERDLSQKAAKKWSAPLFLSLRALLVTSWRPSLWAKAKVLLLCAWFRQALTKAPGWFCKTATWPLHGCQHWREFVRWGHVFFQYTASYIVPIYACIYLLFASVNRGWTQIPPTQTSGCGLLATHLPHSLWRCSRMVLRWPTRLQKVSAPTLHVPS